MNRSSRPDTPEAMTPDRPTGSDQAAHPQSGSLDRGIGQPVTADRIVGRLRHLVDRAAAHRHVHGLVVGVESDDGSIRARLASGDAGPGDAYHIASITKMFTASVIMQLIDEGHLRLEDRVVGLLPDLDLTGLHRHDDLDATDGIEVHHLLHQTSGLADYFVGGLQEDFVRGRDRRYAIEDIIDIARSAGAEFQPGDRQGHRSSYSDTNYQLLTAIVEAITGLSYGEAVHDRITQPLGLTNTYVSTDGAEPRAPVPLPLHHKHQVLALPNALASEQGAGGIVSTLDDQIQFLRAYHDGQLFDPGHQERMRQWNRIFFPIDYGYGVMRYQLPRWMTGRRASPQLIGHSGSTGSFAFSAPAASLHIVGTFNQLDKPARPFRLMTRIVDLVASTTDPT